MPPKKAEKAEKRSSKKVVDHPPYKDMISSAIHNLKERNGSSRQAIKKYIHANYKVGENSDSQINIAIKRGVANGDFVQPKGPSGPVKLHKPTPVKKEPAAKKEAPAKKPAAKKTAAPKKTPAKKASTKKTTQKKTTTAKPKKATTTRAKKSSTTSGTTRTRGRKPKAAAS